MQIASTSYSIEDWNTAVSTGGPVAGDIVWKLANTLWRIFAQVRLSFRSMLMISVNYTPKLLSSFEHLPHFRLRKISG
jgi:hypothetical protein